jgi:hypothetical protein
VATRQDPIDEVQHPAEAYLRHPPRDSGTTSAGPERNTDRSNLLHAITPLPLTADELAVLRELSARIDAPVYRDDVDSILFEYASDEEQVQSIERILNRKADRAVVFMEDARDVKPTPFTPVPEELQWRRSPFRLLACMPFRISSVTAAWSTRLRPAFNVLGDLLRLDWSTDDWVRDFRRLADEASFRAG